METGVISKLIRLQSHMLLPMYMKTYIREYIY